MALITEIYGKYVDIACPLMVQGEVHDYNEGKVWHACITTCEKCWDQKARYEANSFFRYRELSEA